MNLLDSIMKVIRSNQYLINELIEIGNEDETFRNVLSYFVIMYIFIIKY